MAERDYYKVLGVSPDASHEEIRKAYRQLAKRYHPDRAGGSKAAEERFKEINDAYSVLGDAEKRKQYDRLRQAGMRGGWAEGGRGFEDIFAGTGAQPWEAEGGISFEDLGGLGDLFSRIFGGGRMRAEYAARQRGRDVVSAISVPFETAAHGGRVEIKVPREKTCPTCAGTGAAPGTRAETCRQCRGTGQVLSGQGGFSFARPCPVCFGRGKVIQRPCDSCSGTGAVEDLSTVEVKIPPGTETGQKIRLAGLGQPGAGGGRGGDLLLEVRVMPHPSFERKGQDVYSKVSIDMTDAALGTQVDVETLQGEITVKVPPGIQPGQRLRIAGYGVRTRDGHRGDHYVEVQVSIPRNLTEEQRRLLEQLRRVPAEAKR
jgi:molecular chaperone DnaJ